MGTGEDEFSFCAVCLPSPLIIRGVVMDFSLYYLFSCDIPSHYAAMLKKRSEQMVLQQGRASPGEYTGLAHSVVM